jgi:hypothetical protein
MANDPLADAVTRSLSQYLIVRNADGGSRTYDAQLENLLGLVDGTLADAYLAETFARFRHEPTNPVAVQTFRMHLAAVIEKDQGFRKQLESAFGGRTVRTSSRRKVLVAMAAVLAVLVMIGTFLLGRASEQRPSAQPAPAVPLAGQPTSMAPRTTTATAITTTSTAVLTSQPVSSSPARPEVPGDGSSLTKGVPVHLTELPRPNDEWTFQHGDHDVQFALYPNSLWYSLGTCSHQRTSGEQQFRLKNFSRIEVKAIGTDSTSDTNVAVRFDVFVNDDKVNPAASQVVGAGETKELALDLPADVFAVTLRSTVDRVTRSECREVNAVWGAPHVVAAGR